MSTESVTDKEELKPGVFINSSILYVRISRLPYSYEILSTPTVTKATNAGNLKSVHWGNLYLNIFERLAELSGFLILIFIIAWSTGDVPEACGS